MLKFPKNIKDARILLANDDSIHSHGFKVLEETIKSICDDVWVVAPETEQSAVGHSLTIHTPLRMKQYGEKRYSVFGTPTDCVMMGAKHILADKKPDLVISGINHGHNVADDVTYSGTVAVAIEGTIIGIPSIAFSNSYDRETHEYNWDVPRRNIPKVLLAMQGQSWAENVLINVNFPYVEAGDDAELEMVVCEQGHYEPSMNDIVKCTDPRGRPYFWIGPPDSDKDKLPKDKDIGQLIRGKGTITPLSLNLTHKPTLKTLEGIFKS
tara:strand:- start:1960 stop:2760 length:801 start_codon:yes stop_codon:yes gene_type:complete